MITIEPVNKKTLKTFIQFPWKHYANDRCWVPPLLMDVKKMFSPKKKHPFYEYGDMELFLAKKDGKVVGRIAAIINNKYNEHHPGKTGFFGFFESIDDQEVANKLLDTAKSWLQQQELEIMHGPASPSSNYEYGLLVDGFDEPPKLMMSHNKPYYQKLFEQYGLQFAQELYAYKINTKEALQHPKLTRGVEIVKKRYNVELRPVDLKNIKSEVHKVKQIYNAAWEVNWGFVPLTDTEIDVMADEFKLIAEADLIPFIYVNGQLAGMAVASLDLNHIFKKINGKLFPFGFLKLFTEKKKINWIRVVLLGILPEFRGKGLDAVLYHSLIKSAMDKGVEFGEGSWILADNEMMNRGMKMIHSSTVYKRYYVYEMSI